MTDASKTPMDHKYLNPECCEHGCQTLVLQNKIESITRQRDGLVKALTCILPTLKDMTYKHDGANEVAWNDIRLAEAALAAAKETNERPV